MAGPWETVKRWLGLTVPAPPVADWDTVGVFPGLYADEAPQAAPRAACEGFVGSPRATDILRRAYVEPQPTEADLADPDQEWIEVTSFGEYPPRYVGGRPPARHFHA